jgi:hypothetical protein
MPGECSTDVGIKKPPMHTIVLMNSSHAKRTAQYIQKFANRDTSARLGMAGIRRMIRKDVNEERVLGRETCGCG